MSLNLIMTLMKLNMNKVRVCVNKIPQFLTMQIAEIYHIKNLG